MTRDGFRLELPTGKVFEATFNVSITSDHNYQFVFNGGREALALFDETAQPNTSNGQTQAAFVGSGAGVRQIIVEFEQYKGSPDTWGNTDPDTEARAKRDALDNAIATTTIDSRDGNIATLEYGEYSASDRFDPLSVVVSEMNLPFDPNDELGATSFRGTITFLDAADLAEVATAAGLKG